MQVINVQNVQDALPAGLELLKRDGIKRESRNGPVIVAPGPVTTVYRKPMERVIFHERRDANPFLHFFEALWMLAGRNDLAYMEVLVKRFRSFSDDGETLHGAYGHRWINHFPHIVEHEQIGKIDQLRTIASMLERDPMDRRCVLQMWDATVDLGRRGKDIPCNTQIYFSRQNVDQALDMTVSCRSNDIVWGAYGANAVHMSVVQEYVAALIGCGVGTYYQMSNNFHGYLDTLKPLERLHAGVNPYMNGEVTPYPMFSDDMDRWRSELHMFLDEGMVLGMREPFFRKVAQPMQDAFLTYKNGSTPRKYEEARFLACGIAATDWRKACIEWITRREQKWKKAADNGVDYER